MQKFVYYAPTEMIFGKDTEQEVGALIKKWGGTRVFIVYGGGSVIKSGLLHRIEEALTKEGIMYELFGGAKPNPTLMHAEEGVRKAIAFQADFILPVGGGSAIDTAKAIAHGTKNQGTALWDIWTGKQEITESLPLGVVLTIAAAGSEMSASAVLTNEAIQKKSGLGTELNRPKFAILNPELTYSLPKFQLTCGIVDILMHTLDRYFTHTKGNQLTDEFAEALLRTTFENGRKAYQNQNDYEAMSELMWCGSMSHNGVTGLGAEIDFAPHKIGHELSAKYDVAHGASLSAIWGAWAEYVYLEEPERFQQYAKRVWDIEEPDAVRAAQAGIKKTVKYFKSIDMPVCLGDLEVGVRPDQELKEMAANATGNDTFRVAKFKELGMSDIYEILKGANHD